MEIEVHVGQRVSRQNQYGDWETCDHSVTIRTDMEQGKHMIADLQYSAKKGVLQGFIKDKFMTKDEAKEILGRYAVNETVRDTGNDSNNPE